MIYTEKPHIQPFGRYTAWILTLSACIIVLPLCWAQELIRIPPPPGSGTFTRFGENVVVRDRYLFISAPDVEPIGGYQPVYIYKRIGMEWKLNQILHAELCCGAEFGLRMEVNSNWLAISENENNCRYHMYRKSGDQWELDTTIFGGFCNGYFSGTIAMDENTLAMDGDKRVYVYHFSADTIVLEDSLIYNKASDNNFGYTIDVSGNYIVVGAQEWYQDELGVAYVFNRDSTGRWHPMDMLTPYDYGRHHFYASNVFVEDNLIGVTDFNGANAMVGDTSAVYLYTLKNGKWPFFQKIIAYPDHSAASSIGKAMAYENDVLYLGAPDTRGFRGQVFDYTLDNGQFVQRTSYGDAENRREFGDEIDVDNGLLVIGGVGEYSYTGAVYYTRTTPDINLGVLECMMPFEVYENMLTIDDFRPQVTRLTPEGEEEVITIELIWLDDAYAELAVTGINACIHGENEIGPELAHNVEFPDSVFSIAWSASFEKDGLYYSASDFLDDTTKLVPKLISAPFDTLDFTMRIMHRDSGEVCSYVIPVYAFHDICAGIYQDTVWYAPGDTLTLVPPCINNPFNTVWHIGLSYTERDTLVIQPDSQMHVFFESVTSSCRYEYHVELIPVLVDEDGDGWYATDDCNDEDAGIYPGAEEIPNNDIDEDCDGIDLIINSNSFIPDNSVRIYPNPASDHLHIEHPFNALVEIQVFDMLSRSLYKFRAEHDLDISMLEGGVYLVEIRFGDERWLKRVLVFDKQK